MIRRPETTDFKRAPLPPPRPKTRIKRTVRTLLSPEQLHYAMSRESARVDRNGAEALSLVLFRITEGSIEKPSLSAVRLARTILKRIRVTDDIGWFDEHHLGVLLPDTPATGAWRFSQIVCDAVAKRGARPLVTMYSYPADQEEKDKGGVVRSDDPAVQFKNEVPKSLSA